MKKLINILKRQTQSLKKQYIKKTVKWAKEQVEFNVKRKAKYQNSSSKAYSSIKEYYKEQKWYWATPGWHFTDEFVKRMKKYAEEHYEDSVVKLAMRIKKKGLNQDKLKVKTSHVGVNIETILTDGKKTVRAFTIIAEGAIQRPHYRYLIK